MAEPILKRVGRIASAALGSAADTAERANPTGMMRHSIREVDGTIEATRAKRDSATARRMQAERREKAIAERLNKLHDDARYAVESDREDLARALVSHQVDLEAEVENLRSIQSKATRQATDLNDSMASLIARKSQMETELKAIEAARGNAALLANGKPNELKLARAEASFERAKAYTGNLVEIAPEQQPVEAAEIVSLRRDAVVAERLAALRPNPAPDRDKRAKSAAKRK